MIAQAPELVLGFLRNALLEGVGARLPIVAEHEILPDHDAQLVADVVELLGFVIAAAPVPDHVHVGVFSRLQHLAVLRGGDAGGETVERDHVGALAENGDAVDHEFERASPLIGLAPQHDGPQAGVRGGFVFQASANPHARAELVDGLRAITGRVPEVWLADLDREIDVVHAGVQRHGAGGSAGGAPMSVIDRHFRGFVGRRGDFRFGDQVRHSGGHVTLSNVQVGDPRPVPDLEPDRPPDAAGHETRPPVPAVLVGGFADIGFLGGVCLVAPFIGGGNLGGRTDGGREHHAQRIRARFQIWLHVDAPLAEHVIGGEYPGTVQPDLGVCVETFEHELDVTVFEQHQWGRDSAAILPIGVLDPLLFGFVVAIEGVRDQLVPQQVGVDHAGHLRRMPIRVFGAGRVGALPEFPAGIEADALPHGAGRESDAAGQHRQKDECETTWSLEHDDCLLQSISG